MEGKRGRQRVLDRVGTDTVEERQRVLERVRIDTVKERQSLRESEN